MSAADWIGWTFIVVGTLLFAFINGMAVVSVFLHGERSDPSKVITVGDVLWYALLSGVWVAFGLVWVLLG